MAATLLATVWMFALATDSFARDVNPEVAENVRRESALSKLEAEKGTVVIYARGLCCPSCAIGVRKMVSRLEFVDRSRFKKGVDLDAKTQLVSVAILPGMSAEDALLAQAVDRAGYSPVRVYFLEGASLGTRSIALD